MKEKLKMMSRNGVLKKLIPTSGCPSRVCEEGWGKVTPNAETPQKNSSLEGAGKQKMCRIK